MAQYIQSHEREKLTTKNNLPSRAIIKICGEIKIFMGRQKLREFGTIKPALQQILEELL